MNEQQFWMQLQEFTYQSSDPPEIFQAQWERLVQVRASLPLPTQLIIKTACHGSVYLSD